MPNRAIARHRWKRCASSWPNCVAFLDENFSTRSLTLDCSPSYQPFRPFALAGCAQPAIKTIVIGLPPQPPPLSTHPAARTQRAPVAAGESAPGGHCRAAQSARFVWDEGLIASTPLYVKRMSGFGSRHTCQQTPIPARRNPCGCSPASAGEGGE